MKARRSKIKQEAAASMIEMALLIALVSIIAIPSVSWVGESVDQRLDETAASLTGEEIIPPCDPQHPDWPDC